MAKYASLMESGVARALPPGSRRGSRVPDRRADVDCGVRDDSRWARGVSRRDGLSGAHGAADHAPAGVRREACGARAVRRPVHCRCPGVARAAFPADRDRARGPSSRSRAARSPTLRRPVLASLFAILAIVAAQGLILLGAPRGRLTSLAAALRSAMLCALVISLPLLLRLPFQMQALGTGAFWVYLAPPAWFMGLERVLLGDERIHFARLAILALVAMIRRIGRGRGELCAAVPAFRSRHVETDDVLAELARASVTQSSTWRTRRPVLAAIRSFTSITLRRSVLHQGIVVALSAVGLGLAVNTLHSGRSRRMARVWRAAGRVRLVEAAIWAPFALIFVAVLAVRVALLVPVELKANWIFRIIEHDGAGAINSTPACAR